ncbi:hypothetical protein ACQ4LE_004598 [Meloidogyne hapla]
MTSSNSRSEQLDYSSQLSESSSERRDVLERTEDDGDESFCPETEDDELSSDGSTIKNGNANLQYQQIVSASDAGCSVQAVSSDHEENVEEDPEELQRIRRTQKIFKELHFDNPGRQLAERVSIDRSVTEYSNSRPKRNNKNKNKTNINMSPQNSTKISERYSHNDYLYSKDKDSSDGQIIFWRCVESRKGCKGRVWTTSCESREFIRLVTEHSCSLTESSRNANKANGSTNRLSHNQKGQLITNRGTVDLCDCLSLECSGCNYPCKKCGSQKCSYSCRNNRRTYIESIDELGSGITKNPFL